MKKDYYEIIGIQRDATLQQMKKAYRSLALKHHPDRVPEEKKKDAEERFKEISEAYGVLSDPQKRKMYDQYGHAGIDQQYTTEDIFRGADFGDLGLGDIFNSFFGGDIFGGGRRSRGSRGYRGRDIQYEVDIALEEAFNGVEKKIQVPRNEHCTHCQGSGAKPGSEMKTCAACKGQGRVVTSMGGFFQMTQSCPHCNGQGKTISEYCPKCKGKGIVRVIKKIDVKIPPGVDNETQLRVRGEGKVGSAGAGDLYIYIHINPHKVFKRGGKDLQIEMPINFVTAALGGDESVPTLNGNVTMKIPSATQSGKVFRLKGKGMPDVRGGLPGDQYVKVMLQVPKKVSAQQRKILEEYANVSGINVSKGNVSIKDKIKKVFK